jgi:hypothetical protein
LSPGHGSRREKSTPFATCCYCFKHITCRAAPKACQADFGHNFQAFKKGTTLLSKKNLLASESFPPLCPVPLPLARQALLFWSLSVSLPPCLFIHLVLLVSKAQPSALALAMKCILSVSVGECHHSWSTLSHSYAAPSGTDAGPGSTSTHLPGRASKPNSQCQLTHRRGSKCGPAAGQAVPNRDFASSAPACLV